MEKKIEHIKELVINFEGKNRKNREGLFFVLSGSSGVGKNTLLNHALEQIDGIYYLPSITTREIRKGERQGFPYFFVSRSQFEKMIEEKTFLEWKRIHSGDYYGTHLPTITYALNNGYDIITDMDVLGCEEVMNRFPKNAISIFIKHPSVEELRERLTKRESNPEVIAKRLERVAMEMSYIDKYQYVIVNDDLQRAVKELVKILKQYT